MTSNKISGPGLKGLAKSDNRVSMSPTNTMGGGVSLRKQGGNMPGAPTDNRDGGSHSIKAKDRRIANAPTDMKRS